MVDLAIGFIFLAVLVYSSPSVGTTCPEGSVPALIEGSAAGKSNSNCIPCNAGTYADSHRGVCEQCSPGTYQDEPKQAACKDCSPGSYTVQEGGYVCTECGAGYYQDNITSTECVQCRPGTYQPSTGSAVCMNCPAGSYSELEGQTQCTQCQPGTFQDYEGSVGCRECGRGSYSDVAGLAECNVCQPGTSQELDGALACVPCPTGTHQSREGSLYCEKCDYNDYQDKVGQAECKPCPDKKVTDKPGNSDPSQCYWRDCPEGYIYINQGECKICPAGTYQPYSDGKECLLCPRGSYAASRGTVKCRPCPSTAFTQREGASSLYDCVGPVLLLFEETGLKGDYTVVFSTHDTPDTGPYFRSLKMLSGPWRVGKVVHHTGTELVNVNITLANLEPIINNYYCYLPGDQFKGLINTTQSGEPCAEWNPSDGHGGATTAKWRSDGYCGPGYPLAHTNPPEAAQCNPKGGSPCCSPSSQCGSSALHCYCISCTDFTSQEAHDNNCRSGEGGVPYCLNNERQPVSCGVPKCARDTLCQNGLGEGYRGKITSTTLGYTCQAWDTTFPHIQHYNNNKGKEQYGIGSHNYCRNPSPDAQSSLWCYTTSVFVRWDTCDLKPCQEYDQTFIYE